MVKTFVPRLQKPEKGNPYYNTVDTGGSSSAIKGKPTDSDANVLSNCVGYAFGRFNEIGENKKMSYLMPINAERFYDIALQQGLTIEQTPSLGACIVWQKGPTRDPSGSDGAGHVAIVEQVINDGEIITSESGWGCQTPFWTQTRKKANGNWGAGDDYKFLGFIKHPDVTASTKPGTDTSKLENPYLVRLDKGTAIYSIIGTVATECGTVTVSTKYTIVEETILKDTKYGKLKSGAGWVVVEKIDVPGAVTVMKFGDTGADVLKLQKKLISLGYLHESGATSTFDKLTLCAVTGYQLQTGLLVDGVCGPATQKSLALI